MSRTPPVSAVPSNRPPRDDGHTKYRLRDREGDPPTVWGENLTHQNARILRDKITASKQSRSMVIEPIEPSAPEDGATDDLAIPDVPRQQVPQQAPIVGTEYQIESEMADVTLTADGVISKIPPSHQLLVNGQARDIPTRVQKGNTVSCRSLSPDVAQARAIAADAVAQVINSKRKVPVDVTVRRPAPRSAPAPLDRTVSNRTVVRLSAPQSAPPRPLASPLKVATIQDGDAMSDDAITDAEIPDLAGDLGGGPSDADVEHAKRQAEAERSGG
jgi:hypothetical protein